MGKANHILKDFEDARRTGEIFSVNPDLIQVVGGWNDRTDFTGEDELVASIKEVGVRKPLMVKKTKDGTLELIDGERRLRATMRARAEGAGIKSVPVIVANKTVSELDLYMDSVTANAGKPLSPTEQANSFKRLVAWGVSVREIAARACVSKTHVRNRLELSTAIPAVKAAVDSKEITVQAAQEIAKNSEGKIDAQADALEKKKAEPKKPKVKPLTLYLKDGSVRYSGGGNFETCPPVFDLLISDVFKRELTDAGFDPETIKISISKVVPVETELDLFGCEKTGISRHCCNTDVKLVQERSRTTGNDGPNEYLGAKVRMCKECRKANCGGFRIVT
jgi:ParB/RepB/Spo0J family partition protein